MVMTRAKCAVENVKVKRKYEGKKNTSVYTIIMYFFTYSSLKYSLYPGVRAEVVNII